MLWTLSNEYLPGTLSGKQIVVSPTNLTLASKGSVLDTSGLSGAPKSFQGHHKPVRGTYGLVGAPQARQGHHRPARKQGHHRSSKYTRQACQGHNGPVGPMSTPRGRGTTVLPGAPQACEGHQRPSRGTSQHRPARGTTDLPGAPEACQEHHRPRRGNLGLSGPRGTTGLSRGTSGFSGAP